MNAYEFFLHFALPVPPRMVFFTYAYSPGEATPLFGGRVLVPFRHRRMTGIGLTCTNRKPSVKTNPSFKRADAVAVSRPTAALCRLDCRLFISHPLGEVFRTMLPLNAEFKRAIAYSWR